MRFIGFIFKRIEVKEHWVILVSDGARFYVKDYKSLNRRTIDDISLLIKMK